MRGADNNTFSNQTLHHFAVDIVELERHYGFIREPIFKEVSL